MEFKEYPKRIQPEKKFSVCICGHYWHKHEIGFFELIGTKCEKCICNRYREIGQYTFEECQKLGVE